MGEGMQVGKGAKTLDVDGQVILEHYTCEYKHLLAYLSVLI